MKAAVLFKPNEPLQVVDCELDPPKAGEVRVKMKASGVCQSDWHIMNGDWPSPLPIVPGHEAAGEIAECGPGVTTVKPGDHVIFSFRPHCGRCRYCTQGRTVLCIGRASVPPGTLYDGTLRIKHNGQGINQMARIGTFAEEVVVPEEMVIPIRKDMPWPQAALVGCCVATGVGAVTRHAKIEAGSTVLVIGCGGVGLNAVQGALLSGASKIIAADILDNKLEMAKTFGATHTINTGTNEDALIKYDRAKQLWKFGQGGLEPTPVLRNGSEAHSFLGLPDATDFKNATDAQIVAAFGFGSYKPDDRALLINFVRLNAWRVAAPTTQSKKDH